MAGHVAIDWDSATVKLTVPIYHTALVERQEVEVTLAQFAEILTGFLETEDGTVLKAPSGAVLPFAWQTEEPA